jgi:sugar transferase (PEP-CTERM/EpsH1 system associated)
MRDLLFLSHRIPYPADKGDKIRSFHILKHLSSRFRIHLGCFYDDPRDGGHYGALRELCAEVFCLPIRPPDRYGRALKALMRGQAISQACCQDPRMSAWVASTLSRGNISDIFLFCTTTWPYVSTRTPGIRVITDMVDVDSEKWGAFADSAPWPLRQIYRREQRKIFALERLAAADSDYCLFVSEEEAGTFARMAPDTGRLRHINNGVDLEKFDWTRRLSSPFDVGSAPIVFTGMMNYRPNIEAVTWFAEEILPAVRRTHPHAVFWIVGAQPAAAVRHLADLAGVRVTGRVDDVRPYLSNASCVIAPLRIGRGVQNKVLEAMAMAKPVVLTPAALEGLDAASEREVLVAEDAPAFARNVSEVIAGKWDHLGAAARAKVEADHLWHKNLEVLDTLFAPAPSRADCALALDAATPRSEVTW